VETDYLSLVAGKREDFLSSFNIPQLGGIVHASGGDQHAMRIE
jgi:hypothetical protein